MNWWNNGREETPTKILTDWQSFRAAVSIGLQCLVGLMAAAVVLLGVMMIIRGLVL